MPARRTLAPSVTIATLLPDALGTYGDGGNATVLAARLRWRGFGVRRIDVTLRDPVPRHADIYLLGGGEDTAQVTVARRLRAAPALRRAVEAGAVLLAVCAGLQLLGEWFADAAGRRHDGLGLLDLRSDRLPARALGEVVARPLLPGPDEPLLGFENHGGRTELGPALRPLATVVTGVGNGSGGGEGVAVAGVVGTYLHGPVLARNPALADALLTRVVGRLDPLDDSAVTALRARLRPTG